MGLVIGFGEGVRVDHALVVCQFEIVGAEGLLIDSGFNGEVGDMNALRAQLARHALRQGAEAEFRDRKGGKFIEPDPAAAAAGEEDRSLPASNHAPGGFSAGMHAAEANAPPHVFEGAALHFQDALDDAAVDVVHGDVDGPEFVLHGIEQCDHGFLVGRVGRVGFDLRAGCFEFAGKRLQAVRLAGDHGDGMAGGSESPAQCDSQPRTDADNDGGTLICHSCLLLAIQRNPIRCCNLGAQLASHSRWCFHTENRDPLVLGFPRLAIGLTYCPAVLLSADGIWKGDDMASARDNQILTEVGPGTPMGMLLRHYWLPALMSSEIEIEADGDPVRVMLLGEKLVAFRDSAGKVGVMDHRCPHRCASLFFGRNDEGGIRCVYHGWKFDTEGNCLDMANVPPHQDFKHKVHAKAYPSTERNGVVWVYMGDEETVPELPGTEVLQLPDEEMSVSCTQRECNWLQALEGDIDTSHPDFLHGGTRTVEDFEPDDIRRYGSMHRDPEFDVQEMPYGILYGARRPADPGEIYWRIAQYMMPFWTITPSEPFGEKMATRAWVPMDDSHSMLFNFRKKGKRIAGGVGGARVGVVLGAEPYLENTTDWYGRWRYAANSENDYQMDREKQRRRRAMVKKLFDEATKAAYIVPLVAIPRIWVHSKDLKMASSTSPYFPYGASMSHFFWK